MLVRELEETLLELVPATRAEAWDRTGMLVGDPSDEVGSVVVALDPSLAALNYTRLQGANILVTHHPMFIDAPEAFLPADPGSPVVGTRIRTAIQAGISVLSFHTALDAHPRAAEVLSAPLGLQAPVGILEPSELPDSGYGRVFELDLSLGELAGRCQDAFGRPNRCWGNPESRLKSVCFWTGAAGEAPQVCLEQGVDAFVCGEVKYHTALDASESGLGIVELGHDVSEQVFCPLLVELLLEAGLSREQISVFDQPALWR